MSHNSAVLNSYETYQIVLGTLGTIYASFFVKISNHYIFKPKIQHFFIESIISSKTLFQLLVDFLTNLTQLTFIASSMFMLASDDSLAVMIYSDMSWCGLLLALVSFSAVSNKEEPNNRLLTAKNVVFLVLAYALVVFHYSIEFYSISLGIGLIIIYLLNLILNSIEEKFIEAMEVLFGYKPDKEIQQEYEYHGHRNSPEFLCKHFPITLDQVNLKMKSYEKQLKNIKINTRKKMTENLLKIALAVHLSSEKMAQKGRRDIKNYYGNFNGTVLNKSRKLIENRLYSKTTDQQLRKDSENKEYDSQEYDNSALFYLFPVKIFQSSKILSVLFSLIINLGLGVMIAYGVDMASNLQKGEYLHLLYGFLLLPLRPSISREQFMNSMALSSLWKYCIYGIFLSVVCLSSSSMSSFNFKEQSKQLVFVPLIQGVAIITSARLIRKQFTSYSLIIVWIAGLVTCSFLIYKFC